MYCQSMFVHKALEKKSYIQEYGIYDYYVNKYDHTVHNIKCYTACSCGRGDADKILFSFFFLFDLFTINMTAIVNFYEFLYFIALVFLLMRM